MTKWHSDQMPDASVPNAPTYPFRGGAFHNLADYTLHSVYYSLVCSLLYYRGIFIFLFLKGGYRVVRTIRHLLDSSTHTPIECNGVCELDARLLEYEEARGYR